MSFRIQKTYERVDFLVGDGGGLLLQDGLNLPVQRLFTWHRHNDRFELFCKCLVDADEVKTIVKSCLVSRYEDLLTSRVNRNTHTVKHALVHSGILLHLCQVGQLPNTKH